MLRCGTDAANVEPCLFTTKRKLTNRSVPDTPLASVNYVEVAWCTRRPSYLSPHGDVSNAGSVPALVNPSMDSGGGNLSAPSVGRRTHRPVTQRGSTNTTSAFRMQRT